MFRTVFPSIISLHVLDGLSVHHQSTCFGQSFRTSSVYMFWTVFPSIISLHVSDGLSVHHQSTCFGWSFRPSSVYMFRTVFLSIISLHVSDGLSVHHQESETVRTALGVCQTGLLANLFDIHPMLYVQSRTPDDGQKDRQKRRVLLRNKIVQETGASLSFYNRNIS
jgi:hypothetical protein